jgi:ABC-type sugar transport system substrate-binding protein
MFGKRWGLFQIVVLVTVFSAVLMVAAFDSGAAGSKKLVVGIANHAAGNEFINNMVERMKQRLEELGASYNYAVADGSLVAHNTNIENLIAKGLKVIVIVGGDADGLKPIQKLAVENDSMLISADTGLTGEGVLSDVTSDNAVIGRQMAEFLVDQLDGKGEIVIFREPFYAPTEIRWRDGAKPIFDKHGGIKIVGDTAVQFPDGTIQARSAMENHLVAHPNIKGVWAVYDQPAMGAIQSLRAAGMKDVVVVGADGDKQNIMDYIAKGLIQKATVAQNSKEMGKICADIAVQYLKGEKTKFPAHTYAPVTLVTQKNAEEFAKQQGWLK